LALVEGTTAPLTAPDRPADPVAAAPAEGSRRHWRWWLIGLVVLAAGALGIAYRHTVGHQIAISVSRQSTAFTQLYFTQPDALPKRLVAPGPDSFSFTIANSEGHSTNYAYTVTLGGPLSFSVVSKGTLRVADGGSIAKTIDLFPASSMTDYEVTVTLGAGDEVIHFQGGAE
jgi:hypothetical protein